MPDNSSAKLYNLCMSKKAGLIILFTGIALLFVFTFSGCSSGSEYDGHLISPHVILIIGDGMGFEQVKAAGYYQYGEAGLLSFENLPYQTEMTTSSQSSSVTDSAASATAMATGRKVANGVISRDIPGSYRDLKTMLEIASANGKSTGLVTTTFITHATPAAFAAHTASRGNYEEIGNDYLSRSRPDVLFGGGSDSLGITDAESAGYISAGNLTELEAFTADSSAFFLGSFGTDHMPYMYDGMGDLPELSDMALKVLVLLEQDDDGFFLMIEGGRIDHAGHDNDLIRNIYEVLELSDTVEKVLEWAEGRTDTTIIVTADHETGGLAVLANNGVGVLPDVSWSTGGHTGIEVPVYIWGNQAQQLSEAIADNTDIYHALVVD